MSSVIQKLLKRRCYPVSIAGEEMHLRMLTIGEGDVLDKLKDSEKTLFAVGCSLVDADGKQQLPRQPDESYAAYAARLSMELADMGQDMLGELMSAILKLAKIPSPENLQKN